MKPWLKILLFIALPLAVLGFILYRRNSQARADAQAQLDAQDAAANASPIARAVATALPTKAATTKTTTSTASSTWPSQAQTDLAMQTLYNMGNKNYDYFKQAFALGAQAGAAYNKQGVTNAISILTKTYGSNSPVVKALTAGRS